MKVSLKFFILAILLSAACRGQIFDGSVAFSTGDAIHPLVPPFTLTQIDHQIPVALVTNVINTTGGPQLVGEGLQATEVAIGTPTAYLVSWNYTAVHVAGGGAYNFAIVREIKVRRNLDTAVPVIVTKIVLDPPAFQQKFRHREYAMQIALYGSQWFYDWLNKNYASPLYADTLLYLWNGGWYITYTNRLNPGNEVITIGPTIPIGG